MWTAGGKSIAYQRYRAGFEEHGGLDDVADTVRKLHRRYLEETNKRLAEALAAEAGLDATGLPPQRSFWPASAGAGRRSWSWMPSASISHASWRKSSVALAVR